MILTYSYFLGLKNLSNIYKTTELIKRNYPDFSLPKDEDDFLTYEMLRKGDVLGVFQLESQGMKNLIVNMKVASLEDLTQAIALYRPGPMEIIPTFLKRKNNEETVTYPHPHLEQILKETYGTIVYQEQIMLIATTFAGYTLGQADILRRAVSKKKKDVLEKERVVFVNSSVKKGYSEKIANEIYDYIVKFANYGFNKAHSVAYAKLIYITAFLKCYYLPYYLVSLMDSATGATDSINEYYKLALSHNLKVNGPDVNVSDRTYKCNKKEIYFPLGIVKGLGNIKISKIIEARNDKPFANYDDFIYRTSSFLDLSNYENLIYSGALDCFGLTKKAMISTYKDVIERFEYSFVSNLKPIMYPNEEFSFGELSKKEQEVIGFNIKYEFFEQFKYCYKKFNLIKLNSIKQLENQKISTIGFIRDIREITTKKNEKMAFCQLTDDTKTVDCILFPKVYVNCSSLEENTIIILTGTTQIRNNNLQISIENFRKV